MGNLTPQDSFDDVYKIERSDVVDALGVSNLQAQQNANRTHYLNERRKEMQEVLDGLGSAAQADAAEFVAAAAKGADDGVCELVGGLVPSNRMPPIAINEVFTVVSEEQQLALVVQAGDMAVRTDQAGQMYVRNNGTAGDMTDWTPVGIQLPIPTDAPADDKQYARRNGAWVEVMTPDPAVIEIADIETTDHTLTVDDPGLLLMFNSANAVGITLTNSLLTTDFPAGRQVTVANRDVGDITITAPAGVTVKGPTSLSNAAMHSIYRVDATTYFVAGKEA